MKWAFLKYLDLCLPKPDGKGVHREVGSEGLEKNHRVVIEIALDEMNRSVKDEQWLSLHHGGEGFRVPAHRTVNHTLPAITAPFKRKINIQNIMGWLYP